ncbi:hypothetical protein RhiXN_04676 [Rhizoctonia solani]|uniref:Uncharacterized protein n=1 Tax=Rhizoctonia solani TaxID=456999 RepID=A0A8H8NNS6_9AGAM|nr:uncharacterized protein RhiXN_04676 [Rhizoctonia solani]QRW16675.1 hypothetical protein RhiXN_04676 [Rhizoctonia solani]
MSTTNSIPSHTSSYSSSASRGDQTTRILHSSFHTGESQHQPTPSLMAAPESGQSSAINSPVSSDISLTYLRRSVEDSIHDDHDRYLPTATATTRDRLVGKVEKVLSKVVRDPELHERAMLREVGGKELADGMAMVNSKDL